MLLINVHNAMLDTICITTCVTLIVVKFLLLLHIQMTISTQSVERHVQVAPIGTWLTLKPAYLATLLFKTVKNAIGTKIKIYFFAVLANNISPLKQETLPVSGSIASSLTLVIQSV